MRPKQRIFWSNPLHCAVDSENRTDVKKQLRKTTNINHQGNKYSWTALYLAAYKGNEEIVKILIDGGININLQNKYANTILHSAAYRGNKEIVEILVEKQVDLNVRNNHGKTALHLACHKGNEEIIEVLAKGGADLNVRDNDDKSPLDTAVLKLRRTMIINSLIRLGANVNLCNKKKQTALHLAASICYKDIAVSLIAGGADIESIDEIGRTPLHTASLGKIENTKYLQATKAHGEVIRTFIRKGSKLNAQDSDDNTPLHLAVQERASYIIKILVEAGADLKAKNLVGDRAFDIAHKQGEKERAKYLSHEMSKTGVKKGMFICTPVSFILGLIIISLFASDIITTKTLIKVTVIPIASVVCIVFVLLGCFIGWELAKPIANIEDPEKTPIINYETRRF